MPLSDRLAQSPLSIVEAVRYGMDAADALAYAHDRAALRGDTAAVP